jgi:hypothetical protein
VLTSLNLALEWVNTKLSKLHLLPLPLSLFFELFALSLTCFVLFVAFSAFSVHFITLLLNFLAFHFKKRVFSLTIHNIALLLLNKINIFNQKLLQLVLNHFGVKLFFFDVLLYSQNFYLGVLLVLLALQ